MIIERLTLFLHTLMCAVALSLAAQGSFAAQGGTTEGIPSDEKKQSDKYGVIPSIDVPVSYPKTFIDMLKNLHYIVDSDLLLNDALYSDGNLLKLTGGKEIRRSIPHERDMAGAISDFGNMFPLQDIGTFGYVKAGTVQFRKTTDERGVTSAYISLDVYSDSGVGFDSIEDIFGKRWVHRIGGTLSPHSVTQPASSVHGNQSIEYDVASGGTYRQVIVDFASDGSVSMIYIGERR